MQTRHVQVSTDSVEIRDAVFQASMFMRREELLLHIHCADTGAGDAAGGLAHFKALRPRVRSAASICWPFSPYLPFHLACQEHGDSFIEGGLEPSVMTAMQIAMLLDNIIPLETDPTDKLGTGPAQAPRGPLLPVKADPNTSTDQMEIPNPKIIIQVDTWITYVRDLFHLTV